MNDEDLARELAHLHADTTAGIKAATPDDMNGPIVLANGMWANLWHGVWRVTADRDGAETIGRFVAPTLDECRHWAGAELRDSKH
ncbi:hypothetical protein [Nocardia fluminea]|uniref:hypothetical protein n=1 Tax=Nocardia fluminea TaxID=134984 RepID=UPI003D0F349E